MSNPDAPFAVVDIGSNTAKLAVFACAPHAAPHQMHHESDTVRIGQGVSTTGLITDQRADRLLACLEHFEAVSRSFGATLFQGVATEAFRQASNGSAVLDRIASQTSWQIRVITGESEAMLTWQGARPFISPGLVTVVADVGGASTELVVSAPDGDRILSASVPVGSGSLFDDVVRSSPPARGTLDAAISTATTVLRRFKRIPDSCDVMLLPGGTGNLLDQLLGIIAPKATFDSDGLRLLRDRLEHQPADITAKTLSIQAERAQVLPASLSIVISLANVLDPCHIQAIPTGVGRGIAQMVCSGQWPPRS